MARSPCGRVALRTRTREARLRRIRPSRVAPGATATAPPSRFTQTHRRGPTDEGFSLSGEIHTRGDDDSRTSKRAARGVGSRHARTPMAAVQDARDRFGRRFGSRPTIDSKRRETCVRAFRGEQEKNALAFSSSRSLGSPTRASYDAVNKPPNRVRYRYRHDTSATSVATSPLCLSSASTEAGVRGRLEHLHGARRAAGQHSAGELGARRAQGRVVLQRARLLERAERVRAQHLRPGYE